MNARLVVLDLLHDFDQRPRPLDRILDKSRAFDRLEHRDRRFAFDALYGIMRHRLTLDHAISRFVDPSRPLKNDDLLNILRLGAYQILYMDRVPNHASVNESVNAAKISPRTRHGAGLVNAVLRKIIAARRTLPLPDPKNIAARLSVEYSHPQWLVARWLARLGLAGTKRLLAFDNERPVTYLRRKIRGLSRQQFEIDAKPICGQPTGFMNLYYPVHPHIQVDCIALLRDGWCTVQAPSSGWVCALLDPRPGDRIFDACSAPGGKTTLLAELVAPDGAVYAGDVNTKRLADLVGSADRMHLTNVSALACDGKRPCFKGTFDKILLDVPCTGTGVFHRHPEARWLRTEADIAAMASTQAEMLQAAATALSPKGTIVYSTCSLEPEENEEVVNDFLAKNSSFRLRKPGSSIPRPHCDTNGFLRILPHEHAVDGMFAAVLQRTG